RRGRAKLVACQMQYRKAVPVAEKVARCRPYVERAGWSLSDERLAWIIEVLGDRLRVFGDILLQAQFLFADELSYDEKAFAKRVQAEGAPQKLADYRAFLAAREAFDAATLDRETQAWVAERGMGLGDIVHAVRVAVTGTAAGPGLFDCLALLGKETSLLRIDRALAKARG